MSVRHVAEGLKYGAAETANAAETLEFSSSYPVQRNPHHCPQLAETCVTLPTGSPVLGAPMNIAEVAALLGCSAWTVRQRYMRQGLPCLRASAAGKLVFFHKQVVDWILRRQQLKKGGNLR
jgi:hypothetical protein